MNIDRHNYEEFFLLYVDNELSAPERNMVQLFVQQNPDLDKELQLLQQSIVKQDEIIFEDKGSLLKEEIFAPMQEKLLLFADDELSLTEKIQVESLLATNTGAAGEWKILQQTKLQPDTGIVFPDKRSLYRTEGGKVVGFRWWRVAAAAILLGFGIWTGVAVYKNNTKTITGTQTTAEGNNKKQLQNSIPDSLDPSLMIPTPKENNGPETVKAPSTQKEVIQPVAEKKNSIEKNSLVAEKEMKKRTAPQKDNNNLVKEYNGNALHPGDKKPSNNLPKPLLENINKPESNKTEIVAVQPKMPAENNSSAQRSADKKNDVAINKIEKNIEPTKISSDINGAASTNLLAKNAVYNETEEQKNDNKILYMDEDKVKRTKIGGIFRKLKRVIERKTNIKTGDGIKVAGFEIAIK